MPQLDAAYNLARWIVGGDQDAQKIVQEAYAQALKEFPRFRGGNARAWLLTIVRDTAASWTKKQRPLGGTARVLGRDEVPHVRASGEKPASIDPELEAAPLLVGPPERSNERKRATLEKALQRLPPESREVLVLFELEGWSYKTIAAALEVSVPAVMSRLSRARRSLQAELKKWAQPDG
ncbi:MAG: sigma-70 family RNA polymerase sigma factor [Verrucomicrobia bacterium]|nr:sigma-70 family RNA polymerase sigma factor [Verrucomicrobiota bacterium]